MRFITDDVQRRIDRSNLSRGHRGGVDEWPGLVDDEIDDSAVGGDDPSDAAQGFAGRRDDDPACAAVIDALGHALH